MSAYVGLIIQVVRDVKDVSKGFGLVYFKAVEERQILPSTDGITVKGKKIAAVVRLRSTCKAEHGFLHVGRDITI